MRWSNELQRKAFLPVFACAALLLALANDHPSPSLIRAAATANPASPQSSPQGEARPQPTPAATPATTPSATQEGQSKPTGPFIMIDASHGGSDHGVLLGSKLLEKDITLAFARRLKSEIEDRGIAVRLLRDADTTMTLEERADTTNKQHPALYISVHAGVPGPGVRIYTPLLPSAASVSTGKLIPWESAQSPWLSQSQTFARAIETQIRKGKISPLILRMPLRPLNNIAAPAIAVELTADPATGEDAGPAVQSALAESVATGIIQALGKSGEAR